MKADEIEDNSNVNVSVLTIKFNLQDQGAQTHQFVNKDEEVLQALDTFLSDLDQCHIHLSQETYEALLEDISCVDFASEEEPPSKNISDNNSLSNTSKRLLGLHANDAVNDFIITLTAKDIDISEETLSLIKSDVENNVQENIISSPENNLDSI